LISPTSGDADADADADLIAAGNRTAQRIAQLDFADIRRREISRTIFRDEFEVDFRHSLGPACERRPRTPRVVVEEIGRTGRTIFRGEVEPDSVTRSDTTSHGQVISSSETLLNSSCAARHELSSRKQVAPFTQVCAS
jgi:hypothetical protein